MTGRTSQGLKRALAEERNCRARSGGVSELPRVHSIAELEFVVANVPNLNVQNGLASTRGGRLVEADWGVGRWPPFHATARTKFRLSD
jgi:hypothetical protein